MSPFQGGPSAWEAFLSSSALPTKPGATHLFPTSTMRFPKYSQRLSVNGFSGSKLSGTSQSSPPTQFWLKKATAQGGSCSDCPMPEVMCAGGGMGSVQMLLWGAPSTLLFHLLSVLSTARRCQVRGCHCLRTPPRRGISSSSLKSSSPPASHPRRSRCCARHC